MNGKRIVFTVFLAIVEYRVLFFVLNLIAMAFFLLFVYLRRRLKRPSKSRGLCGRNSNSNTQTSSFTLTHNPGQLSSQERRAPGTPPSVRNSQLSYIEIGFIQPAQALTVNDPPNHLAVPSSETESLTISYRTESIASRPLPAVTRTFSGRRGSQPHHRPSSWSGNILSDSNEDERHGGAGRNSEPYLHFNNAGPFPTARSSSTLPTSDPNYEVPNVGIGDIKCPDSPTNAASVADEESSMETPGRRDSIYTEKSIMTLPVYKENEDERMSIASRAPTYRSTIVPRESMPPLPVPPSIYLPTLYRI